MAVPSMVEAEEKGNWLLYGTSERGFAALSPEEPSSRKPLKFMRFNRWK